MNRRELFKGLGAALAAASIPFPVEAIEALPPNEMFAYLYRVRVDLMHKIVNPPCIMHENGKLEVMKTDVWQEALRHINILLKELA